MSDLYSSYKVLKNNEGQAVQTIPSYEVAKMMEKEHWEVLRMLEGSMGRTGLIQVLIDHNIEVNEYFIKSSYKDKSGKLNKCYECTKMGCELICQKSTGKKGYLLANKLQKLFPNEKDSMSLLYVDRPEITFIDELEDALKPFNIKGIRQFSVLSYRIDYYIPSLKIAIEYDENEHKGYSYEAHEGRQQEIEKALDCRFIRVSDENTNSYNIGLIIKNIFNI